MKCAVMIKMAMGNNVIRAYCGISEKAAEVSFSGTILAQELKVICDLGCFHCFNVYLNHFTGFFFCFFLGFRVNVAEIQNLKQITQLFLKINLMISTSLSTCHISLDNSSLKNLSIILHSFDTQNTVL